MMKTEMGAPAACRNIQIGPPWEAAGVSGVSATAAVSVGADWQGGQFRSR